jgi:hypothetical protein
MYAVGAISVIVLFVANVSTFARVLRVPEDYGQIQLAIDISLNGDTILVSPGLYEEALEITDRSITISGMIPPDSATGLGAIINPSNLENSNELACLTPIRGDSLKLKNLWFQNGAAMHIGREINVAGGIDNTHGLRKLILSTCRFDSVYACIRNGIEIEVDSVVMHNSQLRCIAPGDSGRVIASYCRFHGAMTGSAVWGRSGSRFYKCSFTNSLSGYLLIASKDSIRITECEFGPYHDDCSDALVIRAGAGTVIENNLFHEIETGGSALLVLQSPCSTITDPQYEHPVIRGNRFERISSGFSCQYGNALHLHCNGGQAAYLGLVADNVFIDVHSRGFYGSAIQLYEGSATLENNRFVNISPTSTGAVYSLSVFSPETLFMRSNAFDSVEYAIQHGVGNEVTDARWNWWGDSTGPYSSSENPNGLGAEVDWGVQFVPWLTMHPDSSTDTTEVAIDDQVVPQPTYFSLSAYPNPFNATTTLQIEVARAGEYEVVLFDLLGRKVAELFKGRIETARSLNLKAESLASGLYFARLSGKQRALATKKLLLLK